MKFSKAHLTYVRMCAHNENQLKLMSLATKKYEMEKISVPQRL